MSDMPTVYAVVLNWNGWHETLRCLASLRADGYPSLHIIVVDNGSTDDSQEHLAPELSSPGDMLVRHAHNEGFTGGANKGIWLAIEREAEYIFLLNNDATVVPGCIAALVAAAGAQGVGMLGPRIVWDDEPARIWSAGIKVPAIRPPFDPYRGELDDGQFSAQREVDALSGCALLIPRSTLRRTGLLDSRYFAYYEDVDLSKRASSAGLRLLLVGEACAMHKGSATSNRESGSSQSSFINYYGARNSLLFLSSHASLPVRPLAVGLQSVRLATAALRIVVGGSLLGRSNARGRSRAILAGVADAARGRFGPREEDER